jgi:hypothetical protein
MPKKVRGRPLFSSLVRAATDFGKLALLEFIIDLPFGFPINNIISLSWR